LKYYTHNMNILKINENLYIYNFSSENIKLKTAKKTFKKIWTEVYRLVQDNKCKCFCDI